MNKDKDILLSVCMVVYNQEQYVRDALDSVLMQKVNFPIEVIISDDCSTDATPQILREYAEAHPDVVKPIFGSTNVGYPNNQRRSLEAATGKYIALCDSDDYWTDPYKLQKQVDYMEAHPECAICFHNVMHIYDGTTAHRSLLVPLDFPSELTIEDVITRRWFLATNSEVFRREYISFPDWYDSVLHIDYVLNLIISQYGTLHYMPDVMSVYRHTSISVNAQHRDGEWGYMLFHSQTMKTILEHMYDTLESRFHPLLDKRIAFYEEEIKRYEKEQYYEKNLLSRMFRPKTYKRAVKRELIRLLSAKGIGGGVNNPLLTVCVRTHNQKDFIREALESVLMQKTDFDFEIIVSDDASSDGTVEILQDYQSAYPDKIRLLLNETNVGGPENLKRVIEASDAKYVTCLDGDDFYTDDYKLQKQVDILEAHPEYAACFHNTWHADSKGRLCGLFNRPDFHALHDAQEFIRERWFVPIHSAVLRREYIDFPDWYNTVMNDDYVVHLSVVKHGPYFYMPDVMVAYRHHGKNTSRAYHDQILTNTQLCTILENMKPLYPVEYATDFDERIAEYKEDIARLNSLSQHPWLQWLYPKTFRKLLKQWIRKKVF